MIARIGDGFTVPRSALFLSFFLFSREGHQRPQGRAEFDGHRKKSPPNYSDDEAPIDRFITAIESRHEIRNHENKRKNSPKRVGGGRERTKGGRKKTIGVESNCERGSSTTRTNQKKNSQPRPFFFWFYKSTSRCERPAAERELKEVPMADEVKRVFSLSIFSSLRRGKKKLLLTFPLQRAPSSPRAAPRPPCPPPPRSPRSTSRRAAGP